MLDVANIKTREEFEQAVLANYEDDPEGRDAAVAMFEATKGIDLVTGMPLEGEELPGESIDVNGEGAAKPLEERLAENLDAGGQQEGEDKTTDAGTKDAGSGQDTTVGDGAKGGEPEGASSDAASQQQQEQLTQQQQQDAAAQAAAAQQAAQQQQADDEVNQRLAKLERENAELRIEKDLNDKGADILARATQRVDARRTSDPIPNDLKAKIAELEEGYGEEVGGTLKDLRDRLIRQDREAREREIQAETNTIRDEMRTAALKEVQEDQDLAANRELQEWLGDWQAAQAGDATKDGSKYQMAVGFDWGLRQDPAWQGRTDRERFAEATRMVKEALKVDTSSGAPDPSTETGNKPETKVVEQIEGQLNRGTLPETMASIPGGVAPTDAVARLEQMTALDLQEQLEAGRITVDDMDELMARRMDEDYF